MSSVKALVDWLPDNRTAALVTSPLSLRYLCGHTVEAGLILAAKEAQYLLVSERDFARLDGRVKEPELRTLTGGKQLLDLLIKYGIKHILIEADKMTVSEYQLFKEQLHYAELDVSDRLSEQLLKMRSVKNDEEIISIATAQRICDKAYERLLGNAKRGMTERQIASLMDFFLVDYGSEGVPFPTAIRSGENTAKTRAKPSDRPIGDGDFLIMEFGAVYNGYCARMCRTAAVGEVSSQMENAYKAVSCAISDGLRALRAGIGGKVADSVARSTLNAWDMDRYYSVNFAHGIGLEPIEQPFIGQNSSSILKENTTLAVFCGVSVRGQFGIKLCDTVSITDEGFIDYAAATKNLIHI